MPNLRNLFPCHKMDRNAATPFCNTGKINSICHRTTPQKVNHANRRCCAHTDTIFTKPVSIKRKYDNENDRSNDCRDHSRPSAKIGRKANDISVLFITPQNTHPHGIQLRERPGPIFTSSIACLILFFSSIFAVPFMPPLVAPLMLGVAIFLIPESKAAELIPIWTGHIANIKSGKTYFSGIFIISIFPLVSLQTVSPAQRGAI